MVRYVIMFQKKTDFVLKHSCEKIWSCNKVFISIRESRQSRVGMGEHLSLMYRVAALPDADLSIAVGDIYRLFVHDMAKLVG